MKRFVLRDSRGLYWSESTFPGFNGIWLKSGKRAIKYSSISEAKKGIPASIFIAAGYRVETIQS